MLRTTGTWSPSAVIPLFWAKTHLACIEGTAISIGEHCLFSSDVTLRTGDSHAITDLAGKRINASEDIILADHVWVGNRAIITKGASVAQDSVVATGAIFNQSHQPVECGHWRRSSQGD